tara:strand:+ start:9513 stop:10772 length:1260 start_codon:yes stop_codon:yes gene_type:complete
MNVHFNQDDYFPHQWDFLTSEKTINGLVAGFGSGKTHVFLRKTLYNLLTRRNRNNKSNGWVVYPTLSLAEELFVEPFIELLEETKIAYKYNQSKHLFKTPLGNIKIYQLQKPQRIIGAELTFIGFDEFDVESWKNCDMAFKKAVGRMRGAENPEIYIVTSPEGFKYTHKIFCEDASDDRYLVHGKTTDNTYLPEKYISLLETNYDANLLKAYRDGEFINLQAGSTYYTFDRKKNVGKVKYDPKLPIRIGMDWNVSPLMSVLWQQYHKSPHIRVFDVIELHHAGEGDLLTERMCETIKQKYPNNTYFAYPDATGAARNSSARYSDIGIVKKAGFNVKVLHINPLVVNRVNAVNKALEGNIIIDESCKALINDLERVTNIPNTREINKKENPELTHASDAFGYSVVWEYPVNKPKLWSVDR